MAIQETFASNIFEFDYKSPPTGAELIEFIKKHHLEDHQIVASAIPFYKGPHEDGLYYCSECDKVILCHSENDDEVIDYCENDVIATEAVFDDWEED